MFRDIFDMKCPLSGAKSVFSFFPEKEEGTYGTFYVTLVLCHPVLTSTLLNGTSVSHTLTLPGRAA